MIARGSHKVNEQSPSRKLSSPSCPAVTLVLSFLAQLNTSNDVTNPIENELQQTTARPSCTVAKAEDSQEFAYWKLDSQVISKYHDRR
ncbi:hypothetical protein Trydic_g18942 [Trypoxylus dichotomus]